MATSLLALLALGTLGLRDGTLGVAWPSMRVDMHQPLSSLGAVLLLGTAGYLLSSTWFGALYRRAGFGLLLTVAACASTAALVGFAVAPAWGVLLAASFLLGLANGVIDAGINTYVAMHRGMGVMGLAHASYGLGATAGPLLVAGTLATVGSWRTAYAVLVATEGTLAVGMWVVRSAWAGPATDNLSAQSDDGIAGAAGFDPHRALLPFSLALFFIVTGLELTLGAWTYTLLTLGRHVSHGAAAAWVSAYWGALTVGRLLLGPVARHLHPDRLLITSSVIALAGTGLLWWNPGPAWLGALGLPLSGLGLAIIFPVSVARTPVRMGRERAASVIGWQLASAGVGGSALAAVAGLIAGHLEVGALAPYAAGCAALLLALNGLTIRLDGRRALP
jgi:fucose permease